MSPAPDLEDARKSAINFRFRLRLGVWIDQSLVERSFSPFPRDLQHVVRSRIDALFLQPLSPFRQGPNECLQFRASGRCFYRRPAVFKSGSTEVQHIGGLHIRYGVEYGK